jgi:hypothetical protein
VTSRFEISYPLSSISLHASSMNADESHPLQTQASAGNSTGTTEHRRKGVTHFHLGSVSGKSWPMSGRVRAPRMASTVLW